MQKSITTLFSLENKTALVTGASRGIGWALANGLAEAGAKVYALARSQQPDHPFEKNVTYISCDLTSLFPSLTTQGTPSFPSPSLREGEGQGGGGQDKSLSLEKIDILINAAGISKADDFEATMQTNLYAPYHLIKACLPLMKEGASIINVTSLCAFRGFPDNPPYMASKGALSQLTKAFANDLGKQGIRVNNLVPGYIRTNMTEMSFSDPIKHEHRKSHTMLERWGTPEDLVGAAIFLGSEASSYITGQDIVVDGGWLAKGLSGI